MRNSQVTKFLILFVFVFLCSCDLFKSMCEAEKPPKQSTTLQQIVNDTNAGETIDLEKYSNEYDITDYNAEISKNLTIKNGSFQNTTLKIKAEVKLEKVQELSVETSANLTIRDSKLNNLLLGTNAESRSTNSGNTNFDLKVIVKNCEIAEKIKINSKAKLNIAGEKTKIAKIVVAVAAEVCKILCTTEVDTKKIENVITDENGKKPEEIKITQAYKITYHSNCDELEDIEDFFSPDDGTISLPTDIFKRDGYIFAGWYYDNNQAVEDSINVSDKTADIHVYAGWTKYIPGSGVYKYSINIEDIPESGPWNGNRTSPAFSILLLTDKLVEASIKHGDFYFSNDAYQIQTRASENLRITDTSKTGNYAVYGEVPKNIDSIPENDKYKYYSGVAATVTDTTLEIFVDMSKIVKTELKVFRKSESSTAQEEFVTENTLIDLTDYKPYVIALTTQDKDVNNFKFRAWDADLMEMTAGATFPTNLQQSAPTTGSTSSVTVTDDNNNTETINFSELSTKLSTLSAGTYTLKVSGGITNTTITEIANAIRNLSSETYINLDLSGANGVTTIGDNAFYNCSSLTSVKIGNGVTSIGASAFSCCLSLTSVKIPDNVIEIKENAFISCIALNSVTIGNGVTSIGASAFYNCSGLTSIEIPDSVTTIDQQAFEVCSNLASVTIGNNVTTIGMNAFYNCSSLTNVTIPGNVTTIGYDAFSHCESLTSVTFNNTNNWYYTNNENYTGGTAINVTDTAQNAENLKDTYSEYYWYRPTELTATADTVAATINSLSAGTYTLKVTGEITNNTITEIANAIRNLSVETYINLDLSDTTGLTEIPNNAFCDEEYNGCTSLLSINIPNNVTTIGVSAFYYCENLTSVTIPNSVTTIGDYAFFDCSSLTSVTIGNGVTTIGSNAFYYCENLTSVTIPNSVTTIKSGAFIACSGLTSLTIPDSVTTIGDYAFSGCSGLTSVTFNNTNNWNYTNNENYTGGTAINVTDTAQNADNLKDTYREYYWYKPTELTATADTVANTITGLSTGTYTLKVSGEITSATITTIANAMNSNTEAKINLDLSGANGVTTIDIKTFYECSSLTRITIPNSVTFIGDSAFSWCTNLTNVTISDSVTTIGDNAFSSCLKLTNVTIPDSVISIGSYAFSDCSNLTSVTFNNTSGWYYTNNSDFTGGEEIVVTDPAQNAENLKDTYSGYYWYRPTELTATADTVADTIRNLSAGTYTLKVTGEITNNTITEIANAIRNLSSETYINLDLSDTTGLTEIPNNAFCDEEYNGCTSLLSINIPDNVTTIGNYAFSYCENLTSIEIPNSVTTIGDQAFHSCSSLTSVTIPNSVTTIGDYAFFDCSNLTSVTIPNNVTTIGVSAFSYCENLTSIEIPNSVTTIGVGAFSYCENLTSVTIPNSVTTIGYDAFSHCESLTSIEIPDSVTTIGTYAFSYCLSLTSVTIGNGVTSIGASAFSFCSGLTSIEIPDNVIEIKENAFMHCTALNSVTIGNGVTTIGVRAFYYCENLTSIEIPNSVTTIKSGAFEACSGLISVTFADTTSTWYYTESSDYTGGTVIDDVTDTAQNATKLKETYYDKYWYKESSTGGTAN